MVRNVFVPLQPKISYVLKVRIIIFATASLLASDAFAAPAKAGFDANQYGDSIINLKEISVIAAKQSADAETAGSASTLISRAQIERLNIANARDASSIVPNFYIPEYGSRITSSIYVRGMGARIDQPVVGLVVDNVPVLNKDNYDFDIADIESLQMLRGPQSTMYGRNTMGGVVSIRTLSPLSFQGCRLLLEYGKANTTKASVSHYSRPSRSFGVGGNVSVYHTDGFFRNLNNGKICDKETSGRAMLKLAWKPSDRFIMENMAAVSINRQGGYAYEFADTREINYNDTCFYRRTSVIDGLTMKWRGENVELTSSTSYQFIDDNMTLDQDFLPLSYFTMTQKKTEHAATQDVIVSGSAADGKLRWIGGAFAFFRHMKMLAPVTFKDYGIESLIAGKWNEMNPYYPIVWDEDSFVLGSGFTMPSAGAAAYSEVSYATRRFTLVAGLRFDYEQSRLDYTSDCSTSYTVMQRAGDGSLSPYAFHPVEIHNGGSLKRSFTQLLPKISASYSIPSRHEAKVRLTVAKGYKAGGFNTQMFSDVLQQQLMESMGIGRRYDVDQVVGYKPENSWNAELGALIKTADKQFSASVTAFYIHCRDQQLTVFPEGDITGRIMTNAGKARSAGIEVSVAYSPVERLTLNAAYGYTNAKFLEFNNGKEDYSGRFVPYAPQNTIFAAANYLIPAQFGPLRYISTGLSTQGIGKIYWNEDNSTAQNLYFKLDASVKLICNKFSVDLWAKNITATQYSTFYFVSIQHEFLQRGKPVQFGATLRVNI